MEVPISIDQREQRKTGKRPSLIEPLNEQAKINLTGNAKDLWIAGIRDIKTQSDDLESMLTQPGVSDQHRSRCCNKEAIESTDNLVTWLEKESATKTGPSGIGKENYTWYQQNVHLVPLTWEDEVLLLKRELARAWTALKLEEHRNRNLPELKAADTPEAFAALTEQSAKSLINFFEKDEIVTVKEYFEPALREHLGVLCQRISEIFSSSHLHHDPRPLYSHFYHWFELGPDG